MNQETGSLHSKIKILLKVYLHIDSNKLTQAVVVLCSQAPVVSLSSCGLCVSGLAMFHGTYPVSVLEPNAQSLGTVPVSHKWKYSCHLAWFFTISVSLFLMQHTK